MPSEAAARSEPYSPVATHYEFHDAPTEPKRG